MSGIAGYVGFDAHRGGSLLRVMADALAHRGPDDEGFYVGHRAGLAHRRLAIVDCEGSEQPMWSIDGRYALILDGTIDNYRELRIELIHAGHHFASRGDAEVALAAYLEWGTAAFDRFNGAFAIAVVDTETGETVLARDHFGARPLHLTRTPDGTTIFASEINALLATGLVGRAPDDVSVYRFLRFGVHDDSHRTFFAGITRLLPGEMAVIDGEGAVRRQIYSAVYAELPLRATDSARPGLPSQTLVTTAYRTAARRRLVGDVPIVTHHQAAPDLTPGDVVSDFEDLLRIQQEPVATPAMLARHRRIEASAEHGTVLIDDTGARDLLSTGLTYHWVYLRQLWRQRRLRRLATETGRFVGTAVAGVPGITRQALRRLRDHRCDRLLRAEFIAAHHDQQVSLVRDDLRTRLAQDVFGYRLPAALRCADRSATAAAASYREIAADVEMLRAVWSADESALLRCQMTRALPRDHKMVGRDALLADMAEIFSSAEFGRRPYFHQATVLGAVSGRVREPDLGMLWRIWQVELWLRAFIDVVPVDTLRRSVIAEPDRPTELLARLR